MHYDYLRWSEERDLDKKRLRNDFNRVFKRCVEIGSEQNFQIDSDRNEADLRVWNRLENYRVALLCSTGDRAYVEPYNKRVATIAVSTALEEGNIGIMRRYALTEILCR
jgi:hypothetical protein